MNSFESFTSFANRATPPLPNERSSDAWVLKQYLETSNPVTRCVERDILVSRIFRLKEDKK